jgi:type II restriction endonuclease
MKKAKLYNRQEIEIISKSAIGKSINDILNEKVITIEDKKDNDYLNKGGLGQMVEQVLFGLQTNNDSEPDFAKAGIELKVTPYKKLKDGKLSAKERLVLNIIDYMNEYKNEFQSSHFWFKNNTIQLLWYLWEPNKNIKDLKITHEKLLELAKNEDLKQIEEDWKFIINKIKDGKAHEISEADTMYLAACSKGANANSLRKQPFSEIPAMQRAFCFKNSYMTQLVRKYIGNYSDVEKILKKTTASFNEFVNTIVNKYKGKSQKELMKEFNLDSSAKNINNILISRMFNVKINLRETEEFQKANIIPKTVRIEENGSIKESISFPSFKFTEIINQNWETCYLKKELETTKYMFFVFKKEKNDYIFKGIKLWNMPQIDIETSVMDMWKKTYNTIKSGNIVRYIKDGKRKTNFVGISENDVCHVRPHARDAKDTFKLPLKDQLTGVTEYTKQCFWINSKYIKSIFQEYIN